MKDRGTKGERLLHAEQIGTELVKLGSPTVARLPGGIPRRQVRLAYTTSSSVYPDTGNTFEIIFADATYTDATGQQTASLTDRQNSPQAWVLNIAGSYIPDGTHIEVFQVGLKWYTFWSDSQTLLKLAFAYDNIAYGTKGEVYPAKFKPPKQEADTEADLIPIYNTSATTIWEGSPCIIGYVKEQGYRGEAGWHIVEHFAATHIHGKSDSKIPDGGTGWIYFVRGMDGHYPFASAQVKVVQGSGEIELGDDVIAEWDEVARIWWVIGHIAQNAAFDKRVKVSEDEPLTDLKTGQYLEDQFEYHLSIPEIDPFTDIPIISETVYLDGDGSIVGQGNHADEQVRWYWPTDEVLCWSKGITEFLIHNGDQDDTPQWCTVTPTAKFHNDSCEKDLQLYHEWVSVSTCKAKITFLKARSVDYYDGCATFGQVLGHDEQANWKWFNVCEIEYVANIRLNGTDIEAEFCTAKVLGCGPCEWRTVIEGTPCDGGGIEQPSDSSSLSVSESSSECETVSTSESETESTTESTSESQSESGSESSSTSQSYSASDTASASECETESSSECGTLSASECSTGSASESGTESESDSLSESSSESASESGSECASESSSECDSDSWSHSESESSSESVSQSTSESTSESQSTSESESDSSSESGTESVSESGSESESESSSESNPPCSGCLDGLNPDTLELTFSGIGAGNGECSKCVSMNGAYTVTLNTYAETYCLYNYVDPGEGYNITLTIGSSPPYHITIEFHFSDSNPLGSCEFENSIHWRGVSTSPFRCMELSETINWGDDFLDTDEAPEGCSGSGSSVLVETGS